MNLSRSMRKKITCSSFFGGGVGVFSWSQEPEERNDDEVDDVFVEWPVLGVAEVEHFEQLADDVGVDRVSSRGRVVVVLECLEESSA